MTERRPEQSPVRHPDRPHQPTMKFPFIRRARHEAEVARLQDRLNEARRKAKHAKAATQKHKSDLKQLREQRASELERLRELERLCEARLIELGHYRGGSNERHRVCTEYRCSGGNQTGKERAWNSGSE